MAKCPECGAHVECETPHSPHQIQCPLCEVWAIVEFPSMNKKICFNCNVEFDWKLKPNQKSVLIDGLVGEDE